MYITSLRSSVCEIFLNAIIAPVIFGSIIGVFPVIAVSGGGLAIVVVVFCVTSCRSTR